MISEISNQKEPLDLILSHLYYLNFRSGNKLLISKSLIESMASIASLLLFFLAMLLNKLVCKCFRLCNGDSWTSSVIAETLSVTVPERRTVEMNSLSAEDMLRAIFRKS